MSSNIKWKVLVVDDSSVNNLLLKDLLENNNYEVLLASGGKSALQLNKKHRPHFILLDLSMPGMDGFEVLEELKPKQGIPPQVLIVTASVNNEIKKKTIEKGALSYLVKPLDMNLIVSELEEAKKALK